MTTIDRDGPVPVFRQVVDILRARIESGELAADRPIPSIAQMVQEFGIARGTAAKVAETLQAEGLAIIVPGKGTYVLPADRRPR